MAAPKKGLGSKGLGIEALISSELESFHRKDDAVMEVDMNKIERNPGQPRRRFEESALEELAKSIGEYGVLQPVLLKKVKDYYVLIAGERRWRAAKIAGLTKIPAVIRDLNDAAAFEVALVENLQREDLNPLEEAESYKKLMEEFHYSQEVIGEKVGKSRSTITNALRLLNLDPRVQNYVIENRLTGGHARTLLGIQDGDAQFELAEKIIEEGLSVRTVEALVKKYQEDLHKEKDGEPQEEKKFIPTSYKTIEENLKNIFGTKVKLSGKKNKGKIEIEYYSDDDLDRLLNLMKSIEG